MDQLSPSEKQATLGLSTELCCHQVSYLTDSNPRDLCEFIDFYLKKKLVKQSKRWTRLTGERP